MMDSNQAADHAAIVKVFQKFMMASSDEDAVIGSILPKIASVQVDAHAASSNLLNAINPPVPKEITAILDAANQGLELKLELPNSVFGSEIDQALGVANWKEYLEKCIPCNQRVILRAGLVDLLSDTLLASLEMLINNFLKELAFAMNLLNAPDVYQDACLLLKSLQDVCIPDLQRMLSLFSMLLYKMTAEELASFDIMKLIVTPIFQPIFVGIATLFGQFKGLICDPLECVVTQLDLQIEKLKVGSFLYSPGVRNVEEGLVDADIKIQNLVFGEGDSAQEVYDALDKAREATGTWDDGLLAIQNSMGSSLVELRNLTFGGLREVQSKAEELVSELQKFLGGSDEETVTFMLRQYKKLRMIRMIGFIAALIKAFKDGFDCDLDGPDATQHTLAKFFDNFLGPDAPVIVQVDPDTNDIKLFYDRTSIQPLAAAAATAGGQSQSAIISSTGDEDVDSAINDIMSQALNPISIKPKCFYKSNPSDAAKLESYINQLDGIEV